MSELWTRLVGQDRVTATLRAATTLPGDAYLFAGPPGTGKEEAARVFAAAILCPDHCGTCNICGRVLRGIHPDVVILEPEGYTYPIETIREAVAQAALSPMEGARRIIVVEEADRIVERSQNALLKALEEPNPSVTWVLVTSVLQPILPTILSRCQIVEFAPVPEAELAALVRGRIARTTTGDPIGAEEAAVLVRASRGDLVRAISLVEDGTTRALRTLAIDAAIRQAAEPDARQALKAAAEVAAAAAAARQAREKAAVAELAELEEVLGTGRGSGGMRRRLGERQKRAVRRAETDVFVEFCSWLAQAFRDLAALSAGAGPAAISAPDRAGDLAAAAARRPTAHWLQMAEEALGGQVAIRENAQPALAVEAVLLAPLAAQGQASF
ncbi:MAG TPA: DNA polymerase III subunit [Actinomycetota bacterium]|nr:DNA polymerase III subunit [Actinomycetota bacterium]